MSELEQLKQKLLSRIEIVAGPLSTPCWEWMGARTNNKGEIWWKGKVLLTHRASWEVHRGPIPKDMLVAHRCDNPPCCNPDHLFIASQKDNIRDCIAKDRRAPGSSFGNRRLTEEQVGQIRYLLAEGKYSQCLISEMFSVTQTAISAIKSGRTWPHVEPSPNPVMPPLPGPRFERRF
jgi:hypothetical protein